MFGNAFFFQSVVSASNYVLDNISSTSVLATSLRKLRSAYTGNCIRVRRQSDNVEQNIGFSGNYIDLNAFHTFLGGFQNWTTQNENLASNTLVNCTVTSDTDIAPNGTLTADTMVATATTGVYLTTPSVATNNIGFWTFSCSVKKGRNFIAGIAWGGATPNGMTVIFDGTAGTYQGFTFGGSGVFLHSYSCTTHPDNINYWLVIVTIRRTGTTSVSTRGILGINNNLSTSFLGGSSNIGDTLTAWGLNVQMGFYAGYTPGNITTARVGRVTTIYDQTTNSRNLTMATASNQPYLVLEANNKWGIQELNTRGIGYSGTVFASNSSIWVNSVWAINEIAGTQLSAWSTQNGTTPALYLALQSANVLQLYGGNYVTIYTIPTATTIIQTSQKSGSNGNSWINGTLTLNNGNIGTSGNQITGFWQSHPSFGGITTQNVKEMVLFDTITNADRQTLERNQGTFYNITVA